MWGDRGGNSGKREVGGEFSRWEKGIEFERERESWVGLNVEELIDQMVWHSSIFNGYYLNHCFWFGSV
jgi:hypothetical protein